MHRSAFLAIPVALALATAGCGSSNDDGSSGGGSAYAPPANSATSKAAAGAGAAATVGVRSGGPGRFLVDSGGRTLYLFAADTSTKSTCDGACAQGWPPLTTTGAPKAIGAAQASLLGTTKRSDGSTQVTYGGHPLYTYIEDSSAGQTTGQGLNAFGGLWWVVGTDGKLIDKE
jgi:predicted lipoprotein with Yx(FWY)xxD motif